MSRHKNTSKRKDERKSGKGKPKKYMDFYDVTRDILGFLSFFLTYLV